ncbi:MAG: hypothetical protein EAZ96_25375, partial [Oscillatoriales cyanobacterium]
AIAWFDFPGDIFEYDACGINFTDVFESQHCCGGWGRGCKRGEWDAGAEVVLILTNFKDF